MGQSAMLAKRHAPGDAGTPAQSGNGHLFVRFDRRKWVVEVVKEVTPLLILVGPTEPLGVIFDTLPLHRQQVTGRGPDTPFQTNGPASWHRGDDRAGRAERLLEVLLLPWDDVEYGVLKDHRWTSLRQRLGSLRPRGLRWARGTHRPGAVGQSSSSPGGAVHLGSPCTPPAWSWRRALARSASLGSPVPDEPSYELPA